MAVARSKDKRKSVVKTGLDRVAGAWPKNLYGKRVGLVCHPASINKSYVHAQDVFTKLPCVKLAALFGPQHGFLGNTQDNMIEWEGGKDKQSGLPVYSLYGKHREPTAKMLNGLDVLAIDLQDVGAKYYTFIWTMALCMKAAEKKGIPVVILDRPNPINGVDTEGPVTLESFASFVGLYPLPIRHAMTIAEIALYLKQAYFKELDLRLIKMTGWKRDQFFSDTGLPWVLPSPNMPTEEAAVVYPGGCLIEATNLSEGRGTTRPFELIGAPYLDANRYVKRLNQFKLDSVIFRPTAFEPTFQKHAKEVCYGCQLHVTNPKRFKSFLVTTAMLKVALEQAPKQFKWNKPPYEYETKKLPIDILVGCDSYRKMLERGASLAVMQRWWQKQSKGFDSVRSASLLYK